MRGGLEREIVVAYMPLSLSTAAPGLRLPRLLPSASRQRTRRSFTMSPPHRPAPDAGLKQMPDTSVPSDRPNAFTELMRPNKKQKQAPSSTDEPTKRTLVAGRDGLRPYTVAPESYPPSRVLYYNDKFVVINDLYPKSQIHLLILPRDPKKNVLRPQEAFDDVQFLEECKREEKKVRQLVAEELQRRFGKDSRLEKARNEAMEADEPPDELLPGRDWSKEVKSGIHANPSMSHLHIHVLSCDHVSEPMKKTGHYLSFTTDFFVGLDQFPLPETDYRRRYKHLPEDMHCWRCGKNFRNKMSKLKEHLAEELEEWKKE